MVDLVRDLERYTRERAVERLVDAADLSARHDEVTHSQLDGLLTAQHLIGNFTADSAYEIGRMAAVADWALPSIVEHLAISAKSLGDIQAVLASPSETAAAEFYRRGSYALALAGTAKPSGTSRHPSPLSRTTPERGST